MKIMRTDKGNAGFALLLAAVVLAGAVFGLAGCENPLAEMIEADIRNSGGSLEITNLLALSSSGQVTLSWTNPETEDFNHCEAYFGLGTSTDNLAGDEITEESITVTGLSDNVIYSFLVKTVSTAGTNSNGVTIQAVPGNTGVTVLPLSGLTTTESGDSAQFAVSLDSMPLSNVSFSISSSDPTEGAVNKNSLLFSAGNWMTAQSVVITGVNDDTVDGDKDYSILIDPAVSDDPAYNSLDPADVEVTNTDDDVAEVSVSPQSGLITTESGSPSDYFDVRLNAKPAANVTIGVSSSNEAEGLPDVSTLTFTPANWSVQQRVNVTGVDDDVEDGNIGYSIELAETVSPDPDFDGIDPPDVSVTNTDDDTVGIYVNPTSGLTTHEDSFDPDHTDTFTVVLTSKPSASVTIDILSNDTTEGTVSTSSLTFTTTNWSTGQDVTVTGVDDDLDDGDVSYDISVGPVTSDDEDYELLDPDDVTVLNYTDDDRPPAEVSGLGSTDGDGTVTLTWTNPSDSDLDRIEITWSPGGGSRTVSDASPGAGENEIISGLTNGTEYTFTVRTADENDNVSTGDTVADTPRARYSVTYDDNDSTSGSVPTDSNLYLEGALVTVLGNTGSLARSGDNFSGWNTNSSGTGTTYTGGQTFTMGTDDVTLYAKWTPLYSIGSTGPGNGKVFYDKGYYSDSWRYLEAGTVNLTFGQWGTMGSTVGAGGTAIGTGEANTAAIVAAYGTGNSYAAVQCYNWTSGGKTDWFLPSVDELAMIYSRLGPGFLDSLWYWSSSESSANKAWSQWDDNSLAHDKDYNSRVRAIRAF